jgi:hypothetical protein
MTVRTLAGLGIGAAFAIAVLLGVTLPKPASAGAFKCEDHFLDEVDEMQLRAAALKVLPKSVHLDEVAPCRNPDHAHARISTRKGTSKEGVQQWYDFTCWRKAQLWKCDPPDFRQLINTTLTVDGASHDVELSFEKDIPLERARSLATRAMAIYRDSTSRLPGCLAQPSKESDPIDLYQRNGLNLDKDPVRISVEHHAGREEVVLEDVAAIIGFAASSEDESAAAVCWDDYIIVT